MANMLFTNNASTTLAAGISNSASSILLATSTGALFPNPTGGQYFYCTLSNNSGTIEIVKCTARSTDTLTVTRGQDGTSAVAWNSGDKLELRLVNADLTNFGQLDSANTWAAAQTFSTQPVMTNPLSVGNGGSGAGTFAANNVLLGNGTSAFQVVAPGTSGNVLQSNGTTWQSAALSVSGTLLNTQYFTSSGTYTPTSGTTFVIVEVVGGGGGGTNGSSLPGGGGGGYARKKITSSFSGVTVTIGSGGGNNTNGGTSSFGALISATGGIASGNGGSGSGGDLNITGQSGRWATGNSTSSYQSGGSGGNSIYGFGGTGSPLATAAGNGTGYGGGGGSGVSSGYSGTGSSGIVIVYEYK